ncbi:hypothetical protein TL16_g06274 [Triparma laevis f. inornata]|uniref:EGF-like domain-containing protein n=1 Tax=Triparma laevis f. inornata TaxID=1714386 RepID=A0A9W7AL84_9STRA|nr:hypothetical protein TL16_g06274 [Triparma laevis f. inornata]
MLKLFQPPTGLTVLVLSLLSSVSARPEWSPNNFNATNFACKKPADCPSGFSCYNAETLMEVVTEEGYCDCYVTVGADGDDCQGRGLFNAIWFGGTSLIVAISLTIGLLHLTTIFIKLNMAKAFSLKKASNVAFMYLFAAAFGICIYQWSCFMCAANAGNFELFADKLRPMGVAFGLVFMILCGFQITVVWMKLALKSQAKGGALEKKINRILLVVRFTQALVVTVVALSIITGIITIMRLFSVLMTLVLGIFFHFGGNMLGDLLMPKPDATIEPSVWEKRAEPAKKVLSTARKLRFMMFVFGILIVSSSIAGLVSAEPSKALAGGIIFQLNFFNALGIFMTVTDYLKFGVRKVLSTGKVANFWSAMTTKTTTVD